MSLIRTKLYELVATHLNLPLSEVESATEFEQLGVDSLGVIDLIGLVENALNISIPNEKLNAVNSFDELISVIEATVDSHA